MFGYVAPIKRPKLLIPGWKIRNTELRSFIDVIEGGFTSWRADGDLLHAESPCVRKICFQTIEIIWDGFDEQSAPVRAVKLKGRKRIRRDSISSPDFHKNWLVDQLRQAKTEVPKPALFSFSCPPDKHRQGKNQPTQNMAGSDYILKFLTQHCLRLRCIPT